MAVVDLSIIIVTWNVSKLLQECIESIAGTAGSITYEVIVVDNNSSDDTVEVMREQFPWVKLIANKSNPGFAKANNQGIAIACGEYVLLLNPDTVLLAGALDKLLAYMREHGETGLLGPRLIYPDERIQHVCARRLPTLSYELIQSAFRIGNLSFLRDWVLNTLVSPYDLSKSQPVEAISGAAAVIRRDVINQIGGLDEHYSFCGEDIDYCARVKQAGWEVAYVANSIVIHYGAQSSKQEPYRTMRQSIFSIHRYYQINHGDFQALLYRLMMMFIRPPLLVARGLMQLVRGRETPKVFGERFQTAIAILLWRPN